MKKMVILAGFRFCPTGEELINSYLRPKIMGHILPCNIVEEKQLYGTSDPWDVLHDGNQWMVLETDELGKILKKIIYVFTKLTKKAATRKMGKNRGAGGKEQFVRTAGCGTWDGQTGPREVKNGNGEVIGFRKMLVFEIRSALNPNPDPSSSAESSSANLGHWIMHEYSLLGGESEYVVCEIILDLRKKYKRKRGVVEEDEEVVINPKRLMKIDEEKKDEENVIICCEDVPIVHEEAGPSGMESQVLPLAVEYPNSSPTDHEFMPMTESQEQTLEWEWNDLVKLDELLNSDVPRFDLIMHESEEILHNDGGMQLNEEVGPSDLESQVLPLAVEDTNSSTNDHELMPMTESQEQTLEWDDFINLDELLDSEVPRFDWMPTMESQEKTLEGEWSDLVKLDELLNSDVPRFDLIIHEFEEILHHDGGMQQKDI